MTLMCVAISALIENYWTWTNICIMRQGLKKLKWDPTVLVFFIHFQWECASTKVCVGRREEFGVGCLEVRCEASMDVFQKSV